MKNGKVLRGVSISVLLIGLIIIILYVYQFRTRSITSFFDNDLSKINKINIRNGSNGDLVITEDKKSIKDISDYLSKIEVQKIKDKPTLGWSYAFNIYENNEERFAIVFISEYYCWINGTKYKIRKSTDTTPEYLYNEAKSTVKQ
jgi:hypothetical protein